MTDKKEAKKQVLKERVESSLKTTRFYKNVTNGRVTTPKLKWEDVYQCWAVGVPNSRNADRIPRKMNTEKRIKFLDSINVSMIHPFQAWAVLNYSSYRCDVAGITHEGLIWDELTWNFCEDPEARYDDTDMEVGPLLFWVPTKWIDEKVDYEFKNKKRDGFNTGKSVQTNRMMIIFKTSATEEQPTPRLVFVPWIIIRSITFAIIKGSMNEKIYELKKKIDALEPVIYNDMIRLHLDRLIDNNTVVHDIMNHLSEDDDSFLRVLKHYGDKNVRTLDVSAYPEGSIEANNEVLVLSQDGVSLTILGCGNSKGKPKQCKLFDLDQGSVLSNDMVEHAIKNTLTPSLSKNKKKRSKEDVDEEKEEEEKEEDKPVPPPKKKKSKITKAKQPKVSTRRNKKKKEEEEVQVQEPVEYGAVVVAPPPPPSKISNATVFSYTKNKAKRRNNNRQKKDIQSVDFDVASTPAQELVDVSSCSSSFNTVTNIISQIPFFFNSIGQGVLGLIHGCTEMPDLFKTPEEYTLYDQSSGVHSPSSPNSWIELPTQEETAADSLGEESVSSPSFSSQGSSSNSSEGIEVLSMNDIVNEMDCKTRRHIETTLGIPMLDRVGTNIRAMNKRAEMRTTVASIDHEHLVQEEDYFDQDSEIDEDEGEPMFFVDAPDHQDQEEQEVQQIEYNTSKEIVFFSQEEEEEEVEAEGEITQYIDLRCGATETFANVSNYLTLY
jgi:hypothetical protein